MSQAKRQRANDKGQSQLAHGVKFSDEKSNPGWNFEKKLFAVSVVLFIVSTILLVMASYIARERVRVPFGGVAISKPVTQGASTMTVNNVRASIGQKPFIAPAGYEYVVLSVSVRNNSEKPFDVLPTTDTYIKSEDGAISYVAPFTLKNPLHGGQVLPGETTQGELSFLVSKKTAYKFYVESGWSGGAVSFMVQSNKHKQDTN